MSTEMSPLCFPADRVMRGEFLENLPEAEAADMIHDFRDQSLDEAEETLREESEYWHGMSIVGPEMFDNPEG